MEQFEQLQQLISINRIGTLKTKLSEMNVVDIAAFMEELDPERRLLVFRVLPKDLSADVFSYLPQELEEQIITSVTDQEVRQVMNDLYLDDAVDFLEEVPANVVKKVLRNVEETTRARIVEFLKYPKNSAGSLMTVEMMELHDRLTAAQALDEIRAHGEEKEVVHTIYTMDNTHHLTGKLTLFRLVKSAADTRLCDLNDHNVISVRAQEDQEEVARTFRKYDLSEVPVVDGEGRLVGLITVDDIVDVIQEENTEDMQIMAAVSPTETEYLKTNVVTMARKRIGWLLVLMISATITGGIISHFEAVLQSVVALASYIPMLMDTGGNCGSQSSVMIIRGLALDEIRLSDALKVLWKELRVSLLVGVVLAVVNFVRILIFDRVSVWIALAVSLSLIVTVIVSKCIGGLLPIGAKKLHMDPAVMASPLITTIVDAVSLMVFFLFSRMILGI